MLAMDGREERGRGGVQRLVYHSQVVEARVLLNKGRTRMWSREIHRLIISGVFFFFLSSLLTVLLVPLGVKGRVAAALLLKDLNLKGLKRCRDSTAHPAGNVCEDESREVTSGIQRRSEWILKRRRGAPALLLHTYRRIHFHLLCGHLLKSQKFILLLIHVRVASFPRRLVAVRAQDASTQYRVWILMTMWYFSFSFLINLQTFLHFCFFLSRCVAEWTIMRNKMNFFDFNKWLQWNKEWTFKGVWILSVPTVYIYIYIYTYIYIYIYIQDCLRKLEYCDEVLYFL